MTRDDIIKFDKEKHTPEFIRKLDKYKRNGKLSLFKCRFNGCNNEFEALACEVRKGHTKSCGCYMKYIQKNGSFTHGKSKTSERRIFGLMKDRCYNTNNTHYSSYGGRGRSEERR